MFARLRIAAVAVSLGPLGCDALCEVGIGDNCGPCDPVSIPEHWDDPLLRPMIPDDAVICEASADEDGRARASYWVPRSVHETNVALVGAAQEAGWARLADNWYEDDDRSQMPKWNRFGLARGDRMRIELERDDVGARVVVAVRGVPPPPSLRGDVTVFSYRQETFALFDGRMALLPDVSAGVATALPDGFLFRSGRDQFGRYRGDGTTVDLAPFPASDDTGLLSAHGLGPRGMPWMSHNPRDPAKPLLLGELIGDAWDIEMVPDLKPRLPNASVDVVHAGDGTIWLLCGNALYAKGPAGWRSTKIRASTSPLRPLAAEANSVLISTADVVLRATLNDDTIRFSAAAKSADYAELFDAGALGIAARTSDTVLLIRGDEVLDSGLPGDHEAPDLAANPRGVIAVATASPSAVLVRDPSGSITRYPANGALDARVFSLSVDAMGRVWTLMVDGDPFVADGGRLVPLEGLVGRGLRPSSITFMGNGAPPFLDAQPSSGESG